MTLRKWSRRVCVIGTMLAFMLSARTAATQNITTGALSGTVTDAQGGVLPGASVTATQTATGTKYEAVTGADGRYEIPNVRVGVYSITASLSGFKDQTEPNAVVALGETRTVDMKLTLASLTESVTVTAQAQVIDTARAGTAENITTQEIQALPSIQRSITDVARTSPFFNAQTFGGATTGSPSVSVAGRNNRYNNMQIDGAVNNDLFGLAATGTPGGQTGTQPISYDALQEIQLVVAPYDVRQGGFSGGGINAVTKSGTNQFSGTAYLYGQNQGLVGKIPAVATPSNPSPSNTAVGQFTSKQGGFSIGGPIARNRAFFFGNVDLARQQNPSGFSLDGTGGGQQWNPADLAAAQQALSIIQNQYGFNPGGMGQFTKPTNSDKIFVRTDFNVSTHNQLMVRANYVNGLTDVGTPNNSTYYLPDNYYQIQDKVVSTVGELNTTFGQAFNDFRVTYQRERNVRGDQPGFSAFPLVRVDMPDGNFILLGTDNSSTANKLNQDIVEINDDVTWVKGSHTITVGTHNELFKFYNLFIQNLYGNYRFSSVANLQAGLAQSYSHFFSNTSDPLQAAQFSVQQYGVYAGDQWRAASNFTVTFGARFEAPHFPDVPHANPVSVKDFGLRTDIVPSPKMFSPRVGFNWDLSHGGDKRSQVRGGIGSFAGRTPYVWLSDQYGNTGVDFTQLTANFATANKIPFVANPNAQPLAIAGGAAGNQTINLVDPNYNYPQILRGNLAYDRDLGFWGLYGTAEVLFTKNLEDIAYSNLNYVPAGTLPDGRTTYKKFDNTLNDVILLSNTTQGSSWTTAFRVERPFRRGFYASAAYSYNRAKSINDGTSSVAASNWAGLPVGLSQSNLPLTTSNYQAGSRIQLTGSATIPLPKGLSSTLSAYYNGQQGQPYVVLFNGDANGDGRTTNDILFVPSDASQVNVTNGTFAQLQSFIQNDCSLSPYVGEIAPRNTCTSPWSNEVDLRYAVRVPTGGRTQVELTMDVFNFLNMLNNSWGWVYYPNFNSPTLIGYSAPSAANGNKETYNLSTILSPTFAGTFTRDDLRSRWQAQWGLRIRF